MLLETFLNKFPCGVLATSGSLVVASSPIPVKEAQLPILVTVELVKQLPWLTLKAGLFQLECYPSHESRPDNSIPGGGHCVLYSIHPAAHVSRVWLLSRSCSRTITCRLIIPPGPYPVRLFGLLYTNIPTCAGRCCRYLGAKAGL